MPFQGNRPILPCNGHFFHVLLVLLNLCTRVIEFGVHVYLDAVWVDLADHGRRSKVRGPKWA